jgi:hypothetical protein
VNAARAVAALLILGAVPASAMAPADRSTAPRDKMVCKSFTEIGSLVASKKVCKTRAEWEKDRATMRERMGVNSCAIQPCNVPGK